METNSRSARSVTLTPEYMKKELKAYYNHTTAMWREFLSNAVDAGATLIDITVTAIDDERCRIIIRDNGSGMSRHVFETVYLQLGRSTRGQSDDASIGGFGIARIITTYAHPHWLVISTDFMAVGSYITCDLTETETLAQGCLFEIDVETSSYSMENALREFVRRCEMDAVVKLNGIDLRQDLDWGNLVRSFDILHVDSSDQAPITLGSIRVYDLAKIGQGGIIYQCRGLTMFEDHDRYARVVVDLAPEHIRNVVTAVRDQLADTPYRQTILDAVAGVGRERRPKTVEATFRITPALNDFEGFPAFDDRPVKADDSPEHTVVDFASASANRAYAKAVPFLRAVRPEDATRRVMLNLSEFDSTVASAITSACGGISHGLPDFLLPFPIGWANLANSDDHAAAEAWNPAYWNSLNELDADGLTRAGIAAMWTAACSATLQWRHACKRRPNPARWVAGFVGSSRETRAHSGVREQKIGAHYAYLLDVGETDWLARARQETDPRAIAWTLLLLAGKATSQYGSEGAAAEVAEMLTHLSDRNIPMKLCQIADATRQHVLRIAM